jgi:hypothetical protein
MGGPWGVGFAIDLTPDKKTGIAEWSEENFIKVLRTGKHQGQPNGRDILPPMPWEDLKAFTDELRWNGQRAIPPPRVSRF